MILFKKITTKQEKISIIGLGYVGMPLAVAFAKKADVIGFEGVRGRFPVTHHKDKIRFGLFLLLGAHKASVLDNHFGRHPNNHRSCTMGKTTGLHAEVIKNV
jgi:hypothetical protein